MAIVRWQPLRDFVVLKQAADRWFDDVISPAALSRFIDQDGLPLDVYEKDAEIVVKASLPGVKPDEVDISITGDVLTIKGEHKEEQEVKEENYFRKERWQGTFSRSLVLRVPVETDRAEAHFEDGVLTLTLPKATEARPKQIKVEAGSAETK
ncbi:MAG: Hsp20/alpha crystallin family protein [Dehalococcoidia bacterium]|nr:Hsp20/alpha crystallin family protein [Dehalococcoidia bacterium]